MTEIPNSVFGLMALMITTLAGCVVYILKGWLKEKDLRLADQKENNKLFNEFVGEFSQTSKLLLAKLDGEGKQYVSNV